MPRIDPQEWLAVAERLRPRAEGLTNWFPGNIAPAHVGWYERYFTDSTIIPPGDSMQYWDGRFWLTKQGRQHWRQVGDYPAWRGATSRLRAGQEIVLVRGSRGRSSGPGCERSVRARLMSATPYNVHAVLLDDDPLAATAPYKAGEVGVWHGLSFLSQMAHA